MLTHTASLAAELSCVVAGLIALAIGIPASAWITNKAHGLRAAEDVSKAPLLPQSTETKQERFTK